MHSCWSPGTIGYWKGLIFFSWGPEKWIHVCDLEYSHWEYRNAVLHGMYSSALWWLKANNSFSRIIRIFYFSSNLVFVLSCSFIQFHHADFWIIEKQQIVSNISSQELPQAVCEVLGLENSAVTTPDSDNGEDETAGGINCATSAHPGLSMPLAARNGTKENSEQEAHTVATDWCLYSPLVLFWRDTLL